MLLVRRCRLPQSYLESEHHAHYGEGIILVLCETTPALPTIAVRLLIVACCALQQQLLLLQARGARSVLMGRWLICLCCQLTQAVLTTGFQTEKLCTGAGVKEL